MNTTTFQSDTDDRIGLLALFSQKLHLFTHHKRVSYTLAGAFACAGVAAFGVTQANQAGSPAESSAQTTITSERFDATAAMQTNPSSDQSNNSNPGPNTSSSKSSSSTSQHTSVTVNGQDIPVPENGSTQRTFTSDGGQTSVSVNSSSNGNATNSSSSSLNVQVQSDSSSSSTTSTQSTIHIENGGSTTQ
jgi:hypothetical protein